MKTNVYVDAFNLYYRALKGTPHKWLDLAALCALLLPRHQIHRIKYFTAKVTARPYDLDQPQRQQLYLRALRTIPNISILYGHFLTNPSWLPLADPAEAGRRVRVLKTEEKGSDVNLATHLLADGFQGDYDAAVVITNDSDLLEPIRVVRQNLGKIVGVLHPAKRLTPVLAKEATFFKHIRQGVLTKSQFPATLADSKGAFDKPSSW